MASVNFEKLKGGQQVKAMLRHCDAEQRQMHNHANNDIHKDFTKNNLQYDRAYKESCRMYDERIDMLDRTTNSNKRSDRVTCFGLCIPLPEGLSDAYAVKWVKEVNSILERRYGSENIINVYYHADEKHAYKDAETGTARVSRNHIHAYVIPEIDGQLNGKAFSSKKSMIELNKAIHEMSMQQFHVDFMDGTKRKSKKSVETLKNESERQAIIDARKEIEKRQTQLDNRERELNTLETRLNALKSDLTEKDRLLTEKEKKMAQTVRDEVARQVERIERASALSEEVAPRPTKQQAHRRLPDVPEW